MASGATTEILTHPYRVFRYKVEIESITAGAFSEVSGLEATVDVVEYRTGNASRPTVQKLPGLTRYGNVRLSRGIIGELDTLAWLHSAAADGTSGPTGIQRRLVTITLLDDAGNDGPRWELVNAWPVSYRVSDLNAASSEVALEVLELAHEGFTRLDPPDSTGTSDKSIGSILSYLAAPAGG
ncbi:phage tail protein [Anaerotruncus colihominis]|uniref:Phage tail protein n=1 Tax=Anaerotruncus colihominis TaxID=169435 RepID=A0A1Y4N635_9FIRM|nr:phage tail protein [Anaerotruncus colihominis]OUP70164.1 phage tail protein [Anaerotruncus colihominis]OUP74702.1 phage tail protein [Anaerotruncus colihominis]